MASGDSENRINLFRLQILIIDGGLLVLRSILDQTIAAKSLTLRACLNNERLRLTRLLSSNVITQGQYDLLFPVGGQDPTSADMDITLITCLLANLKCFGLNKKFKWNATPVSTDLTVEADICRLRNFRNKICHISTTTEIDQNEFAILWNEIEQILIRQNTPGLNMHQIIVGFKSCSVDPEEERRIDEEVKKCKDYAAYVDRLKLEMVDVKENVTVMQKNLDDLKENATEVKSDLDDLKENATEVKSDLDDLKENATEVKSDLDDLKENSTEVKSDLDDLKENATKVRSDLDDLKENATEVRRDFRGVKENVTEVQMGLDDVKENVIKVQTDLEEVKRRQRSDDFPIQTEEEKYQTRKKELQGDLIKFYRKSSSSIPLSPLVEEIETPLVGLYVMPDIVAVKQKSLSGCEEERTQIKVRDLLSTGSENQQEIYLIADAGFGKTAFSKYLAITWCQAHRPDVKYDVNTHLKDNELKALSNFEFLFLVFLRDHTSVCHIDDMIEQQFSLDLPSLKSLDEVSRRANIHEVLSKEKCLIILDGLDEWAHPGNSCNKVTEEIPHRCVHDNCVILTTTRPWKFGVSNLKSSQINKKVELVHLSKDSMLKLEENAIRKMSGVHDDSVLKSKTWNFNEVIRERGLEHMRVVPILLMYIVCLWCNNKLHVGNSKHEIYTNIIEFLLSRTSKKHPEVQPSCESSASEIPEYFKGECCKKFYSLITSLAELAYQTLFNKNRENTLVFDRMVAEKYLKADEMKLSLLSGILSESRSKTLIEKLIKVSFSHKTVQEFFAAIFISSQSDARKTVLEKCRNIQDILDMSKIWEFVSGMNADRMCAILNDLMSVINEDELTRDYRAKAGYIFHSQLEYIQEIFMSCLQEMPESENIQLCLQDVFIEYNNVHSEQLKRLLKQNKTNIKSLCICRVISISLHKIIDLFSLTNLSHIQKLCYNGNMVKEAGTNRILFPSLQAVYLRWGKWTNDEENLTENLARLQNLQYLDIGNFTLSHKILETFFNFISGQESMKQLTLERLNCEQHDHYDCQRLNLDLSQHSTLSKLDLQWLPGRLKLNISTPSLVNVTLWGINLDESSVLLSRDMLNIERVQMCYMVMTAGSLQSFITVLENLPQPVTVEMVDIKPETVYKRVRENIRRSQTFHVTPDSFGRVIEFKTRKPSEK